LGAIDFLRRELGVAHFKMLPFPSLIVPLSTFFATSKKDGQNYTDKQKKKISIWFWRTIFNRRYSSDVNERQKIDIEQLLALKKDENYHFKFPSTIIRIDFEKGNFSTVGVNGKSLILLLVQLEPHSFLSGAKIELEKVLRRGSKYEFHHIFPVKYMEKRSYERRQVNLLANICFLTRSDNVKIRAKAPSIYVKEMNDESRREYLKEALCSETIMDDDFEKFIKTRAAKIIDQANILMDA
jgi:hypothetical protein